MPIESDLVNTPVAVSHPSAEALRLVPGLRETLSALVDGETSEQETRWATNAMAVSPAERQAWANYQWVGDALRQGAHALPPANTDFVAAVMGRIHAEAPAQERPAAVQSVATAPVTVPPAQAANDAVFRWKIVAGVATLAAAAALVWQVAVVPSTGPQLAQGAAPPVESVLAHDSTQAVMTERGVVLRDLQLEALLAEHRQYGGMSALQMPAGFLRNATYPAPQR